MKETKRTQRHHACPQCDYKTGNATDLRKHVRVVHEQRKDHACSQCDAAFGRAGDLRTHVRVVHEMLQLFALCALAVPRRLIPPSRATS